MFAGGVGVELGPGDVELTGEPSLPPPVEGDIRPGARHTEPGPADTRVIAETIKLIFGVEFFVFIYITR